MTLAVNIAQSGSNNVTFRNKLINGNMVIDQRNAGASVTNAAATAAFSLDRWKYYGTSASKFTIQQNAGSVTPPVGFANYLGITSLSANTPAATDEYILTQNIEGYNIADLAWGTASAKNITISFQVYSSLTGTFSGALGNSANTRIYPFTYTISSANTWTTASITIAGDTSGTWLTTNGVGIRVNFNLGTGSTYLGTAGAWSGTFANGATGSVNILGTNGATFYITGVQLEAGTTASPFEYRQYGTELALCQRYYEQMTADSTSLLGGYGRFMTASSAGSGVAYAVYNFGVTKRTTPTFVYSGTYRWQSTAGSDSANTTSLTLVDARPYAISIYMNAGSGGTAGYGGAYQFMTSTSYIGFSAEL